TLLRTSGALMASATALVSLVSTGPGIPTGAKNAVHGSDGKPWTPSSVIVGTSGSDGSRVALVTASGRSLPARIMGIDAARPSAPIGTTPDMMSTISGPAPL